MALEAGGYAEKLGNRYEANWVTYQLLQLLDEKILSVTVEPLGEDEIGVDVIIEHHDGKKEFHQCKASNSNNEYWSLSQLNQSSILNNALFQIQRGFDEFHLISPLTSKKLSDLSDSALNTTENVTDFYEYQIKTSKQRKKQFQNLCEYLALDYTNLRDLERVLAFLQRFKVTQYVINKHTVTEIEDKVTALFSGDPKKLLHFLKNYPVELNKLRVKITAPLLLKDLENHGFQPRIKPDDNRITPVIERISQDFADSIQPYLISNSIIHRDEVDQVIDSLDSHAVTLIKAEAGMGKSALMLELHEKIISQDSISVPIRLDRNRPENNADAFGEKLGFPYSPVLCLSQIAPTQKMVIMLDQLDAIRWSATHSNNALQVCQELVRQVLALRKAGVDISIVLASRNFDLDEDVALSSWIKGLGEDVSDISLSHLVAQTVTSLIKPYEKYESLPEEKKKILTIPLWLSIYLVIAERENAAPHFTNKLELVKRFWGERIKEVISLGVSEEEAKQLIDEIVVLMNSKSRLSVPENIIAISSPQTLEALLSVGILTKQSQQISFRHQALFDYQVGIRLFTAAQKSPDQLVSEIGDFSQQTLTKREHLKYALNMLMDYEQGIFCDCSTALLTSEKIRFHIKYLVFNSLKELTILKSPAKKMLDNIVLNLELLPNFISNSCYNNPHIISYLSDNGTISKWLNSEDNDLVDKAVGLLRSIAETSPDTVLKELTPFINRSEEWNNRVYSGLCWNVEDDSDEMFEVRKSLINLGCNAGFVHWKEIASKTPNRALDLIEMLLYHYKDALCSTDSYADRKVVNLTHRDTWSNSDLEQLCNISLQIPEETISRLLTIISEFIGEQNNNNNVKFNWLYKDKYSYHDEEKSITHGIFTIINSAGKQLGNTPEILLEVLRNYLTNNNFVLNHIIAKLLINLPTSYSDLVIQWLLDNPDTRFKCGNTYVEPPWILPGKLIGKFSVNCSDDLFFKLEQLIYYSPSIRDIEKIQWRLEATRRGMYYSIWGEIQYFLLPKLSFSRISRNTKQLIAVLNRKFENYTEADFCKAYSSSGGIVTSSLSSANALSDQAWQKLILAPRERVNKGTWVQRGNNSIAESSIEQFSRSLDDAVRNQPIRFARLALMLPSNIDKNYIEAIYYGLAEKTNSKVDDKYRDEWEICPPDLIEKVISHFDNTGCDYSLVRLLERRITEKNWTENSKKLLINFAINAEDPKPNKLNVWDTKKTKFANDADSDALRSNAINCCRGIAYEGIGHLFWDDENFAKDHQYLIQSAIDDPHPAVNITAFDMLRPMLNYDENLSHKMFLSLCNKDLRMACGFGAHYFFNRGFESEYQEEYINLVLRMLESQSNEVKKEAAKQVFARWFFYDLFQEEINQVIHGEDIFREGVATVLAQFLGEDKHHDRLNKIPAIYNEFVNDDKEKILRTVGDCVRSSNFWSKAISKELFDIFVKSKAALYCLSILFNALERHSGSLIEYHVQLLFLVENITSSTEVDKSIRGMHIQESSLINVLQRLYDDATEDEDNTAINTCLDIWDKLLYSGIHSATNASKKMEKGLLS